MSELKLFHCSSCHREWEGYCPIYICAEIGWEMPRLASDNYSFVESIDELLDEIEGEQDEPEL